MKRLLRWLRWTLSVVVVLAVTAIGLAWWAMRQSLPRIDGAADAPGLAAEASIERDARGIPVISARPRTDLAHATGLRTRRIASSMTGAALGRGELSELFGPVALNRHAHRRFAFRPAARQTRRRPRTEAIGVVRAASTPGSRSPPPARGIPVAACQSARLVP